GIDEIPCIFPASREFWPFRDGFAPDCLLQQGVSCEPDFLYQGAENFAGRRRGTNHRPTTKGFAASEFLLFADLRHGGDWQRFPVNHPGECATLLAAVDRALVRPQGIANS